MCIAVIIAFKPLFKVYNSIGNELSNKVMMTFIVPRLPSGTKTKLKQTNKQNKTQDKYFTTLRWLINVYAMSKLFSRLRKFLVPFNLVFFSAIMMPLRQRKIYITLVNSEQNKSETEHIPQLTTEKN